MAHLCETLIKMLTPCKRLISSTHKQKDERHHRMTLHHCLCQLLLVYRHTFILEKYISCIHRKTRIIQFQFCFRLRMIRWYCWDNRIETISWWKLMIDFHEQTNICNSIWLLTDWLLVSIVWYRTIYEPAAVGEKSDLLEIDSEYTERIKGYRKRLCCELCSCSHRQMIFLKSVSINF